MEITITVNGNTVHANDSMTIMEAAQKNNIYIPSLCMDQHINHTAGTCRICVVEVEGAKNLLASCVTKARDGMVIYTNSPKVRKARKLIYELLMSDHPQNCLFCERNQNCELQRLGRILGVTESRISGEHSIAVYDVSPAITRDTSKCILCRRCTDVCNNIQKVGAIQAQNRGFNTIISPAMGLPLTTTDCAMCGQCTVVCPTDALKETDGIVPVLKALENKDKYVVVQTAPAVRAALGEEFSLPVGTDVTGKMVTALRLLGFKNVFDTNFAADLTIIEEVTELVERLKKAVAGEETVLPMMTSCSPGWIKHIEHEFPNELGHLSSCKSPHTMMGAVIKSYFADKIGVAPENIFVVSVMPCTAKKFEIQRPEMEVNGIRDVDAVLTTRELARMIINEGIDFTALSDNDFDAPLGMSTGAGTIFGVTGGVMEAALRTAYFYITGRNLPYEGLHVTPIEGLSKIKTADITLNDTLPEYKAFEGVTLKVAVTSGLDGADILMNEIAEGKSPYHFIEVMGCPGGCINGGGQPRPKEKDYEKKRMSALYNADEQKELRLSHLNTEVQELYSEFLGSAGGDKSHHLLHTHYTPRKKYNC
ncbi:MAG: NADH-dependent [FeFe] hydrogenase, group A6 [Candidatus Metalachnospira sp.]|nr:NADH-dependent [FeFe] hydrogenase, group A6 [Candidatus Metalachnospira sp.]